MTPDTAAPCTPATSMVFVSAESENVIVTESDVVRAVASWAYQIHMPCPVIVVPART